MKVNTESNPSLPVSTDSCVSTNISDQSSIDSQFSENSFLKEFSLDMRSELVPIMRPLTDYNNNFTENEGKVLSELLEATKYLTFSFPNITSEVKFYSEAMRIISNKWDEEIRKFLKTAKSLTPFNNICENDQVYLIKYASVEVAFMRSIICYDKESEFWTVGLVSSLLITYL